DSTQALSSPKSYIRDQTDRRIPNYDDVLCGTIHKVSRRSRITGAMVQTCAELAHEVSVVWFRCSRRATGRAVETSLQRWFRHPLSPRHPSEVPSAHRPFHRELARGPALTVDRGPALRVVAQVRTRLGRRHPDPPAPAHRGGPQPHGLVGHRPDQTGG